MTTALLPRRPGRARTLAGAVAGFALAAVGAAALSHPGSAAASAAPQQTRLDVSWGDTTPVAGAKVLVYGFAFPGQDGRVLRVQTPTASAGGWRTVGSVRTLANGSFTVYLQHTVGGAHRYRVLAPATGTATEAVSRTTTFTVSRRSTTVTSSLSAGTVSRRTASTLQGTVGPDYTARTVTVQGHRHGAAAWSTVEQVRLDASSSWSVPVPTTLAGTWDYRASVSGTRYARRGLSPVRSLRVTP